MTTAEVKPLVGRRFAPRASADVDEGRSRFAGRCHRRGPGRQPRSWASSSVELSWWSEREGSREGVRAASPPVFSSKCRPARPLNRPLGCSLSAKSLSEPKRAKEAAAGLYSTASSTKTNRVSSRSPKHQHSLTAPRRHFLVARALSTSRDHKTPFTRREQIHLDIIIFHIKT